MNKANGFVLYSSAQRSFDYFQNSRELKMEDVGPLKLHFISFGWDNGPPKTAYDKRLVSPSSCSFAHLFRYKLQNLPNPSHSLRAGGRTGESKELQEEWFSLPPVMEFYQKIVGEIAELLREKEEEEAEESGEGETEEEVICIQLGCAKGKHR
jgi:RNase adaptor protein for sRNA GlmZ degradation